MIVEFPCLACQSMGKVTMLQVDLERFNWEGKWFGGEHPITNYDHGHWVISVDCKECHLFSAIDEQGVYWVLALIDKFGWGQLGSPDDESQRILSQNETP